MRRTSVFSAAVIVAALAIGGPLAASASAADTVTGDATPAPTPTASTTTPNPAAPAATTKTVVKHKPVKKRLTLAQRRHKAKVRKARREKAARARVVRVVKAQIGDRYVHGATGPSAFDCSGLARYVYKHGAHKSLPHTSYAQYAKLRHVSKRSLKPGDLVFFFRHHVHHVGVYVGHGKIVDAENPRRGVRTAALNNSWNRKHFSGAGSMF